jgi:hypothetical protein
VTTEDKALFNVSSEYIREFHPQDILKYLLLSLRPLSNDAVESGDTTSTPGEVDLFDVCESYSQCMIAI